MTQKISVFKEHSIFNAPGNSKQRIWRYLDFTKFTDLLVTNDLYFTRVDQFDDKFEGSNTNPTVRERKDFFKMASYGKNKPNRGDEIHELYAKQYKEQRKHYAINCWHMNDSESAAMWSLYTKAGAGIALTSTYEALISTLNPSPLIIHVGIVKYVDFEEDRTDWSLDFSAPIPILIKRKSFEHERELRAVICSSEGSNKKQCDPIEHGIRLKIDPNKLIEKIYLAPGTPVWCRSLVENLMNKFLLQKPLIQSALDKDPIY